MRAFSEQENSPTCVFKNERVTFKSYINEFTPELYKEFALKAENFGLHSRIEDLFSGRKVNYTEGLAAWHPKYRNEYNPKILNTPSNKNQQTELLDLYDLCTASKNIVTIGIGGSYEGPKMLLENINLEHEDTNFIFITGSDLLEFKIKTQKLNPKDTIFLVLSKSFTTDMHGQKLVSLI